MKKIFLALSLFTAPLFASHAQQVVNDDFDRLVVHYQTPQPTVESRPLATIKTNLVQLPGYQLGGDWGSPALPQSINLITVPFCDDLQLEVSNAIYDTIQLLPGSPNLYPLQPSRIKSDTTPFVPLVNEEVFSTDAFFGQPLASVEPLGIARDRRLANLIFSPLQINPVSGQAIICRSADITVHFINPDASRTLRHFNRYYTPAFSVGNTLNNPLTLKAAATSPLRMVIVVPNSLACNSLNRFADWKRSQGLRVDFIYTSGATNTEIASTLKALYDEATVEDPAPTYLILVGDNEQTPAFSTRITNLYGFSSSDLDHLTDLYFVTWTPNDNLPDCYQGRLSASDTNTLAAIINKTLLYEQYAFSSDDYLARAILIAGEDNAYHTDYYDNAWRYCDPTMDYIAKTYVNRTNGFDTVTYFKNNTDFAPDGVSITGYCSDNTTASTLRKLYNNGAGWVNYSAHGDWDRWYKPSFTNNHASNMSNSGKPSFMIGNCCLTNKFDKPSCFGETLLRQRNNAGAVAYIGGTNSTLWAEDFNWSVGVRTNVTNTLNTSYNADHLGMYDRLFHTHNETSDLFALTAGSMVVSGNMAVNSSNSRYKVYYWEIYELMGDPSLLPWLGKASELTASASRADHSMTVATVPNAYVAVVDSANNIIATGFSDADGNITFSIGLSTDISTLRLAITAQGYKPFSKTFNDITVGIPRGADLSDQVSVYPNPATDRVTIVAPALQRLDVIDPAGRLLLSVQSPTPNHSLDLSAFPAGVYFLRLYALGAVTVKKLIVNK